MKAILVLSLLALSFATGFTCSKNPPPEAAPAVTEAAPQEEMAAPADAAPADGQPAAGGTEAPSGEHK